VSYFRPPKARKTGPWSITRLSNSTQKMSQKGGRVTACRCSIQKCLSLGIHSIFS
jgi:hypothetical protein